jgi:predicted dehydrogenase
MAAQPVRLGILGTATVASSALIAPARTCPDVVIASVGSRDRRRARAFADANGIAAAGEYDEVIDDPAIEAVYVALPNALHAEWSVKALRAGKAVLCEKPLTSNAAEARLCVAEGHRAGLPFVEGFHWRHHPLAIRLSGIVASGRLGAIATVEVRFRYPARFLKPDDIRLDYSLGGGVLMDAGCYCVNLLRMLLGEPINLIEANAKCAAPQVDVAMQAALEFGQGAVGRLVAANDLPGDKFDIECRINAAHGSVRVTNLFLPHLGAALTVELDGSRLTEQAVSTASFDFQIANFAAVVRERAASPTPADDAIANMTVIDAIYRGAGMRVRGEAP